VNAYDNEESIHTTLLEGAVRISSGGQNVVIKPGEQARVNGHAQAISVVEGADLEKVLAWKNGMFNFNGTDLAEAMRQLERWYDIEVTYENETPSLRLVGKMTRGVTLNGLMVVLEELGVRYRLEGRKLTILR
jgi:ferric-dicitrate binding protein FerR (iron transport regulator)